MPPKRNNHYVPQFYLRLFGTSPALIHLYNIRTNKLISNASIKHQCYVRRFYGKDEVIENALADLEARSSAIIRNVINSGRLPPTNAPDRRDLLRFVAIQWLRTKSHADLSNQFVESMIRKAYEEHPDENNPYLDFVRSHVDDTVIVSMAFADMVIASLDDLEFHLVHSGIHRTFVTSDAPVVIYNQYNQSIHIIGMLGTVNRGILLFVPLSPHYLLLLYDRGIYSPTTSGDWTQYPTDKDIENLNLLQFVFADENVYFNGMLTAPTIDILAKKANEPRSHRRIVSEVFEEEGNSAKSQLIAGHPEIPNLRLTLSFLQIRRSARKVPYRVRISDRYRKELPDLAYNPPFHGTKVFRPKRDKPK